MNLPLKRIFSVVITLLDKVRDFIIVLSPSAVRVIIFLLTTIIIVCRIYFKSVREGVDILNFTLICVVLLAIIREDIRELIKKMKAVGLSGLQIPIEDLKREVIEAEEKYKDQIRVYTDKNFLLDNDILQNKNLNQTNLNLNFKIEEQLEEIATAHCKEINATNEIPKTYENILKFLIEKKAIEEDIYQIAIKYNEIENKCSSEIELRNINQLGIRILRILKSVFINIKVKRLRIGTSKNNIPFKGSPSGIELGGIQFEQLKEDIIAIYTTVNLLDSNSNAFPIVQLNERNFEILESENRIDYQKTNIINVEPLKVDIDLNIILTIDISSSMSAGNKLESAKQAAISMIKRILKSSKARVNIAILPFSTKNKRQFVDFGNSQIWTNNIDEIITAINRLLAEGNTPLYDALNFAIEEISKLKGYKSIICISDGEENSSIEIDKANLVKKGCSAKIPVYSIGYGEDKYLRFLVDFSIETNAGGENIGSFMRVNPENISNLLAHLADVITNIYGIYWKPLNKVKGIPIFCKIKVDYSTQYFGKIETEFNEIKYVLK